MDQEKNWLVLAAGWETSCRRRHVHVGDRVLLESLGQDTFRVGVFDRRDEEIIYLDSGSEDEGPVVERQGILV